MGTGVGTEIYLWLPPHLHCLGNSARHGSTKRVRASAVINQEAKRNCNASLPSCREMEGQGDEGCGSLRAGSACLPGGGDEPAAGGAGLRPRPEDGGEDAALLGAAGLPAEQAA